jgi:hypothetical protein
VESFATAKEEKIFSYHLKYIIGHWRIQLPSATVGLAFAPAERDVYSYERTPKRSRSGRSETRQQSDSPAEQKRLRSC